MRRRIVLVLTVSDILTIAIWRLQQYGYSHSLGESKTSPGNLIHHIYNAGKKREVSRFLSPAIDAVIGIIGEFPFADRMSEIGMTKEKAIDVLQKAIDSVSNRPRLVPITTTILNPREELLRRKYPKRVNKGVS